MYQSPDNHFHTNRLLFEIWNSKHIFVACSPRLLMIYLCTEHNVECKYNRMKLLYIRRANNSGHFFFWCVSTMINMIITIYWLLFVCLFPFWLRYLILPAWMHTTHTFACTNLLTAFFPSLFLLHFESI